LWSDSYKTWTEAISNEMRNKEFEMNKIIEINKNNGTGKFKNTSS